MIPTSVRQPSADNPLYGSCLCGGVRFEVTAPFVWASHCHCSRCRKHSGAFGETQGRVPREGFRLLQGEELISVYRPEDGRVKAFCSVCGSSLFGNEWPEGDQIGIRLGALDGDPGIRPSFHTFVGSKAPWEQLPDDGLPRYDEARGARIERRPERGSSGSKSSPTNSRSSSPRTSKPVCGSWCRSSSSSGWSGLGGRQKWRMRSSQLIRASVTAYRAGR